MSERAAAAAAEEDVTLNEMMGKFDESYVYEKETDILSDSDPTDCDDYDDQGGEGGDEQTEEDLDDLDYIDKGSANDLPEAFRRNRGHCTYHSFGSDLVRKSSRSSNRESGRSSRRRQRRLEENRSESSSRASSVRREKESLPNSRRSSGSRDGSCRRTEDVKRRKQRQCRKEKAVNAEAVDGRAEVPNVNRIMMQKFLLRSGVGPSLTGQGSRSAESTPISLRRRILIEEAAMDRAGGRSSSEFSRLNGECNSFRQGAGRSASSSEQALIEADKEADQKYRQLIMEAEHILVSMSGAYVPMRVPHYGTPPMTKRLPLGHLNRRLDFVKNGCKSAEGPGLIRRKNSLEQPMNTGRQVFSPQLGREVDRNVDPRRRRPSSSPSPSPSPLVRRELMEDRCNGNEFDNYPAQWSPAVMPRAIINVDKKQTFTPSPSHFPRRSLNQTREELLDNRSPTIIPCDNRNINRNGLADETTPPKRREPPVPPPRTCTATDRKEQVASMKKAFDLKLKQLPYNANNLLNGRLTPHSPQQPKGWTPIEDSSSGSEGSTTPKLEACFEKKEKRKAVSTATTPTSQRPPLVTFKSVDLRTLDMDSPYCPQSEPVKRKVYAGSTSFDRIHKTLENTQHELKGTKRFCL